MTDSYKSIHTMIKRVDDNIKDTYSKLAEKGATVPAVANQNSEGLSSAVETIKSSTASLCPIEPCGLSFWIDGDANVRQYTAKNTNPYSVNRSKGYMENLMHDKLVYENTEYENNFAMRFYNSKATATGTWNGNTIDVSQITWYPYWSYESYSVEVVAGKSIANPAHDMLMLSHYWVAEGWILGLNKNNYIWAQIRDGKNSSGGNEMTANFGSKVTLSASNLLYFVLTYNANTATGNLYAFGNNGVMASASVSSTYYKANNIFPFSIGGRTHVLNGSGYSGWEGYSGYRLGMIRGWNRVLTQTEMLAAYKNVKGRFSNVI